VSDNFTPTPSRRPTVPVGLPDQGLLPCDLCGAINLPNSYYCCRCGEPLAGGPLDPSTRREVEELLRQAIALEPSAPILVTAGNTINSHVHLETVSLWPASLASTAFVNDVWQRQGLLQHARVLVIDADSSQVNDWLPFLETVAQASQPLVVVAGGYPSEVQAMLAINHGHGVIRCAALQLNPPAETHRLLLQDIARALGTSVLPASKVARTDPRQLPLVPEIRANVTCTIACGLAVVVPPSLERDGALSAQRMAIYGRQAVRVALGEKSRASMEARVRYAARLLAGLALPRPESETRIAPGERPASG
jgi:hypothetical protein